MLLILPTTAALQRIHLVQSPVLKLRSQCLVRYIRNFSCKVLGGYHSFLYPSVAPVIASPIDGEMFHVNRSDNITILCSARGIPPPSIRFLRGGVVLNRTGGESGVVMDLASRVQLGDESLSVSLDDGTFMVSRMLTIFNVSEIDAGNFICEASGMIPELALSPSDSSVFELVVQSKCLCFVPSMHCGCLY